jgi:hypothetical protein
MEEAQRLRLLERGMVTALEIVVSPEVLCIVVLGHRCFLPVRRSTCRP